MLAPALRPPDTTSPPAASRAGSGPPQVAQRIQQAVDRWSHELGVPGVALSVRQHGEPVVDAVAGMASVEESRPLRTDDRLWAGSITKTVAAALALDMGARGTLDLDQPIDRWFPDLPEAGRITIRDLVLQRSGIGDYDTSAAMHAFWLRGERGAWSREQLLDVIHAEPRTGEPGARHDYSNSNYALLGEVLERESGRSFGELVQERIVEPAGLDEQDALVDPGTGPATATTSTYVGGTGIGPINHDEQLSDGSPWRSALVAAGSLVTSAPALARIGEGLLREEGSLLAPGVTGEMLASARDAAYGLGVAEWELPTGDGGAVEAIGHNGSVGSTMSYLLHAPESGATVALLANQDVPAPWAESLLGTVLAELQPTAPRGDG